MLILFFLIITAAQVAKVKVVNVVIVTLGTCGELFEAGSNIKVVLLAAIDLLGLRPFFADLFLFLRSLLRELDCLPDFFVLVVAIVVGRWGARSAIAIRCVAVRVTVPLVPRMTTAAASVEVIGGKMVFCHLLIIQVVEGLVIDAQLEPVTMLHYG